MFSLEIYVQSIEIPMTIDHTYNLPRIDEQRIAASNIAQSILWWSTHIWDFKRVYNKWLETCLITADKSYEVCL